MRAMLVLTAVALTAALSIASPAQAGGVLRGNDTSGIIPWSPAAEVSARAEAAGHCARYGKFARITGVTRRLGDYISFHCLWRPGIARHQIPPVPLLRCPRVTTWWKGRRVSVRDCGATRVVLRARG